MLFCATDQQNTGWFTISSNNKNKLVLDSLFACSPWWWLLVMLPHGFREDCLGCPEMGSELIHLLGFGEFTLSHHQVIYHPRTRKYSYQIPNTKYSSQELSHKWVLTCWGLHLSGFLPSPPQTVKALPGNLGSRFLVCNL